MIQFWVLFYVTKSYFVSAINFSSIDPNLKQVDKTKIHCHATPANRKIMLDV